MAMDGRQVLSGRVKNIDPRRVVTRRSEYHKRHGLAARCQQRPPCLTSLAFAQTPEAFKEGLDVLLQRGGDIIAIALLLLRVEPGTYKARLPV